MSASETPIVCTLDGRSYEERLRHIKTLFARALRTSRRDGPRVHLTFDATARADVENLVRMERACCAFLEFELTEGKDGVELTIAAPAAAGGVDELLAPFIPVGNAASCGCSSARASRRTSMLMRIGIGGGAAALLCAAGCALVVALASAGVGGAWLANVESLKAWRLPILAVALTILGAAWLARYRWGVTPRQLRGLQFATVLVAIGAAWGWIEIALA